MSDTRNYPNYIGVESDAVSSIKIKLKYTGDSEKNVIVSEGSLVSVGHVVNTNGKLEYSMTMGIVKCIGHDATRALNGGTNVGNPFYLVVDKSNTYASDIVTIYIRDIRDIIVGPMAEGNFAKGEQSGTVLPEINDANKDMYDGRFFYLTEEEEAKEGGWYVKGLYYCTGGKWIEVTTPISTWSSPLVASVSQSEDPDKHPEYEIRGDVFMRGTNIINIPAVKEHEFNGITCNTGDSDIRFYINGDLITYQIHLVGLDLPADAVPTIPESPSNVSIQYTVDAEPYKEAVLKPSYQSGGFVRERTLPKYDTPVMTSCVSVNGEFYNVYHRVNVDGDVIIHYPNIEGITEMDLAGYYLR